MRDHGADPAHLATARSTANRAAEARRARAPCEPWTGDRAPPDGPRQQNDDAPTSVSSIIADGEFGPLTSKTANSCIRYFPERIVAVLDRKQAGKTVQDVLGFGGKIPVVGDFERGIAQGKGATRGH